MEDGGINVSRDIDPRTDRQDLEGNFKKYQLDILEEVGFKEKTSTAMSDLHTMKSLKYVTEQTS